MAMIFYTSETEMFIPQQYNEQTLRLTHRALANHARFQMLLMWYWTEISVTCGMPRPSSKCSGIGAPCVELGSLLQP